jgi:hypothetical protein
MISLPVDERLKPSVASLTSTRPCPAITDPAGNVYLIGVVGSSVRCQPLMSTAEAARL